MLRSKVKKIIPAGIKKLIFDSTKDFFDWYSEKSYSQDGEDMVLRRFFYGKNNGFYVDVGAHHPKRFSNTYYFYKIGWRGINIDAMPGSMVIFEKKRSRDINLECAISDKEERLVYYAFNDPAVNGFFEKPYLGKDIRNNYRVIFKKEIKTRKLSDVLDEYLPNGKKIDFMTIDVEGFDLSVLRSNNWEKYIPKFLLVEIVDRNIKEVLDSEICEFLREKGYAAVAKTLNTVFFKLT